MDSWFEIACVCICVYFIRSCFLYLWFGTAVLLLLLCYRVWSVRYNHFHDQLLLTSSSDSRVILNNIVSLSSEPFGHLDEEDEDDGMQDKG